LNGGLSIIDGFIFNSIYKTKALIADKDIDYHQVHMEVRDTEEAEFFFDETTCFKSAGLLYYIYNQNDKAFINHIKELFMLFKDETVSYKNFFNYYGIEKANLLFSHRGATKLKYVFNN
jgi:hypothetical protein